MSLLTHVTRLKQFLLHNTSSKQTVIKNTFRLLLAEGISKGSLAILIIMIGRLFGKEIFGQYSYLSVILTFLVVFADLGITQLTIRDYQHLDTTHRRQYLITGLHTKLLLSIAVTVVYIGILRFTADTSFLRLIGVILLTNTLTNSFLEYIRATFRSLQRGETELKIKLVQGVWNLLLIPLLYLYQSLPLNLIGQSLVTLITIGYARYIAHKRQLQEHTTEIITSKTQLIKNGWMFSMSALFVGLYFYVDGVILQYYHGFEAIGVYNAAYKLLILIMIPSGILIQSLMPSLRAAYHQDSGHFTSSVTRRQKRISIIAIPALLICALIAPRLMTTLYGNQYATWWPILQILILSQIIPHINIPVWAWLQIAHKENIFMTLTWIGALINCLWNLFLIPTYWMFGAAWMTVATEVMVCWAMIWYFHWKFNRI